MPAIPGAGIPRAGTPGADRAFAGVLIQGLFDQGMLIQALFDGGLDGWIGRCAWLPVRRSVRKCGRAGGSCSCSCCCCLSAWLRQRTSGGIPGCGERCQKQSRGSGRNGNGQLSPQQAGGGGGGDENAPAQQLHAVRRACRPLFGALTAPPDFWFCPVAPHSPYRLALSDPTAPVYVSRAPAPVQRAAVYRGAHMSRC